MNYILEEIFVERSAEGFLRIVIKDNAILRECHIQEKKGNAYPGEVYIGVVKNVVPAIKCAFIDINCRRNAYMYMDSKFRNLNLKKGEKILVQVTKEDYGRKGAKVTQIISLPGKYCVLNSFDKGMKFSQKIQDESFKKIMLEKIKIPSGVSVLIRTDTQNVPVELINKEIHKLNDIYNKIKNKAQYVLKPELMFDNGGALGEVLRDRLWDSNLKIYVNNEVDYKYIEDFFKGVCNIDANIELYTGKKTLLSHYNMENEILNLRNNRIELNCGGYIVINKTEAMFVIDVNSGKNIRNNKMDKTVFITNLQAAEEIARQILLKNLSGIIVIDFIDMEDEESKKKIMDKLKSGLSSSKSKVVVYSFTELNLVQIARKRQGKPIYDYIEEDCRYCEGTGKKIKLSYMMVLIRNEISNISCDRDVKDFHIHMDVSYEKDVENNMDMFIKGIGAGDKRIYITYEKKVSYKVEPLQFMSQIEHLKVFRVN